MSDDVTNLSRLDNPSAAAPHKPDRSHERQRRDQARRDTVAQLAGLNAVLGATDAAGNGKRIEQRRLVDGEAVDAYHELGTRLARYANDRRFGNSPEFRRAMERAALVAFQARNVTLAMYGNAEERADRYPLKVTIQSLQEQAWRLAGLYMHAARERDALLENGATTPQPHDPRQLDLFRGER